MSSDLDICNAALLMANANTINSFGDSTREALMCKQLYATTRDAQLSKFSWSFSIFQEKLARTTDTPLIEEDYAYEFQLPVGYIRILKTDDPLNEYRIFKDKLFSNNKEIDLQYQKDPGEEFYPAYFVRVVELKMAELLSLSLVQDEAMAQAFQRSYLIAMREARGTDSQNTPNLRISEQELSLTAVREAGSQWRN